jgi:predicted DNA-binding protein with PD1-like motif
VTSTPTDFGFLLTLEPGDEVVRCLIQFARAQEVDAAVVTGIGSIAEAELGAGGGRDREHRRRTVREPLEACSITGTVTLVDGEPFPHLHGTFARADHSLLGGHVYQAVCATSVDLSLHITHDTLLRGAHPQLMTAGHIT